MVLLPSSVECKRSNNCDTSLFITLSSFFNMPFSTSSFCNLYTYFSTAKLLPISSGKLYPEKVNQFWNNIFFIMVTLESKIHVLVTET